MSQRLLYVMDPMCSWCWGFAPVIERIIADYPQLPLHLVAGGLRPGARAPLDDAARSALGEHWEAVAIASGQPFLTPDDLPDAFVYNTEPACRALVTGRDLGIAGFPTLLAERNGQLALLANGYQSPGDVVPLLERWVAAGESAASA